MEISFCKFLTSNLILIHCNKSYHSVNITLQIEVENKLIEKYCVGKMCLLFINKICCIVSLALIKFNMYQQKFYLDQKSIYDDRFYFLFLYYREIPSIF